MAEMPGITAAIVTVSDSCARGEREDLSGPAVARVLQSFPSRLRCARSFRTIPFKFRIC